MSTVNPPQITPAALEAQRREDASHRPSNSLVAGLRELALACCDAPISLRVAIEDAAVEIERLTRDRDLWKERHDRERAAHAKNLTEQQKVEAERDRLRAALSTVQTAFDEGRKTGLFCRLDILREAEPLVRSALSGEPTSASETSGDWRPIETAPRDGQYILVKMPEWRSGPPARVTRWKDCASPGWDSIYSPAPVAWAPLPGSPQKAGENHGG